MAWQSPAAMGNGTAAGGSESNAPMGAEYTLQGVMRFLQMEWQSHERARNAWDIERAEMKAKIAKQEGDSRKAKKLNEQLDRQIRMLEKALKNERAKSKGDADEEKENGNKHRKNTEAASKSQYLASESQKEFQDTLDFDRDALRDKSKHYLTKCVQEITYLLTPPSHPPPPQSNIPSLTDSSNMLAQQQDANSLPLEEMYLQRKSQQQGNQSMYGSSGLNHQQALSQNSDILLPGNTQPTFMTREQPSQQGHALSSNRESSAPPQPQPTNQLSMGNEEPLEQITHSFDNMGRPVMPREEEAGSLRQVGNDESDGWNFDGPNAIMNLQAPENPPPRRPDTDAFPSAHSIPAKSPTLLGTGSQRRKVSGGNAVIRRRSSGQDADSGHGQAGKADNLDFKVRYALRGHLCVVRSVLFTGGGSPSEPEICTAGDDGLIKRWIIPAEYGGYGQNGNNGDVDIQSYFTHRGHEGMVTSLAACSPSASFSTGGRALGDGWIISGGQDSTVRVWERGRVDPKATLEGHTDAVWTVCLLPATTGSALGADSSQYGGADRLLLASGSADGTVKIWSISTPPQLLSPQTGSRRGVGGTRRHSVTSGSNFPSSPQPSVATATPFHYTLIHSISRAQNTSSPTCISPLSLLGDNFVVSYEDSSILIFDTRTGEEIIGMASSETYDGTPKTGINAVVATSVGPSEGMSSIDGARALPEEESVVHGATGSSERGGVEGVVISGHEDRYIRFFDANSGQCTYSMLAHPSAISSLSLSKDGREAVSAGHDASIRFWSLEKRICTQEITSHRIMRGEGVCSVVWSHDGRLVVSAGGDGVVKVFAR